MNALAIRSMVALAQAGGVLGAKKTQPRLLDGCRIHCARAEEADKAGKTSRQCLREKRIVAQRLLRQPETQNDEGVGCPIELAVEAAYQPVAPQDRKGVIAVLAKMLRFVDFPDVIEAEEDLRSAARAHIVERGQEGHLFLGGRVEGLPRVRNAARAVRSVPRADAPGGDGRPGRRAGHRSSASGSG